MGVNAFSEYSIRSQSLNQCSTVRRLWGGGEKLLMGLYNDIHVHVLSLYEGGVCISVYIQPWGISPLVKHG